MLKKQPRLLFWFILLKHLQPVEIPADSTNCWQTQSQKSMKETQRGGRNQEERETTVPSLMSLTPVAMPTTKRETERGGRGRRWGGEERTTASAEFASPGSVWSKGSEECNEIPLWGSGRKESPEQRKTKEKNPSSLAHFKRLAVLVRQRLFHRIWSVHVCVFAQKQFLS